MGKKDELNPNRGALATTVRSLAEREAEDQRLREKALDILERGTAENTRLAYASDWKAFCAWAREWGMAKVSASGPEEPIPESVLMLYMTHLAEIGRKPNSIYRAVCGIAYVQLFRFPNEQLRTPKVKKLMKTIRAAQGSEIRQAAAMLPDDLRRVVESMNWKTKALARRDRALMLLGWAGAFRRSEIAGLDYEDLRWTKEGLLIHLEKSKADQERRGVTIAIVPAKDPVLCPIRALEDWLELRGKHNGHLFCKFNHQQMLAPERMPERQLRYVFHRWVRVAKLESPTNEKYTPHSLRAGFITTAAQRGVPDITIMKHSRHKNHNVFMGYVRKARPFEGHAGKDLI